MKDRMLLSYDMQAYPTTKTSGKLGIQIYKASGWILLPRCLTYSTVTGTYHTAVIIRMSDGGSVFYGHTRVGYKGKKISVYKFRSMKTNAGDLEKILTPEQLEQYVKEFKIDNDPRITKIGGFLRKTSLDELPQLINILKGELSIVGPRPIVEKETEIYGK
ncbi:MAG: sugar transferase [Agathobacter rectalis]